MINIQVKITIILIFTLLLGSCADGRVTDQTTTETHLFIRNQSNVDIRIRSNRVYFSPNNFVLNPQQQKQIGYLSGISSYFIGNSDTIFLYHGTPQKIDTLVNQYYINQNTPNKQGSIFLTGSYKEVSKEKEGGFTTYKKVFDINEEYLKSPF